MFCCGAEKEIRRILKTTFIAEQTSPVLLTGALPGRAAGPVDTAGVRQALVTERTLPAVFTPANRDTLKYCTHLLLSLLPSTDPKAKY